MSEPLRVANCSGFYGDRLAAAREMVEGGPIDVLTGDYLAELTLMILLKDKLKNPELGYARTFLRQLDDVAATCCERGIKIVVNAGGLNPGALARAATEIYGRHGLTAEVAWIEGDDLLARLPALQEQGEAFAHMETGAPLRSLEQEVMSANAYLGGFSTAEALDRGADLVVCPRVTDAALVLGPAAWKFRWARDDWDRLAAAVVAGHLIECGAQCTGGNYSFFSEIPAMGRPGFPIAEMYEDGSFVITKHEGTDGAVTVGTVTAQLLYEIGGPRYANPDVVARFDSVRLEQEGPDRVRVSGVRGEPAPPTTKVCINYEGGYKNETTWLISGLDIDAKARLVEDGFWAHLGGREQFAETRSTLRHGAADGGESFAFLSLAARDPDEKRVGRRFFNAGIELALASYPGFKFVNSSRTAHAITIYWPALVSSSCIEERVRIGEETITVAPPPASKAAKPLPRSAPATQDAPPEKIRVAPLGSVLGARSGDKGGNANVGFWARSAAVYDWMAGFLTVEKLRELYPEADPLNIERFELPNIMAVNFVIHGLLGEGVSASLRPDPQAKMLGEEIRARHVPIPAALLDDTQQGT